MAIIWTRRGTRNSLIAATFLGVPLCEIASQTWVENPCQAFTPGAASGLVAWLVFIRPVEALASASSAGDPFRRLFGSTALASAARLCLTLSLLAALHIMVALIEFCAGIGADTTNREGFIAPVYRAMGIPAVTKLLSGIWVALAVAGSLRPPRIVATSARLPDLDGSH